MRGGWSPFSGLHCKIVNSLSQGNFTLVGENSRDFKNLRLRQSFKGFEIFLIGLKDFPCLFLPVLKKSWNVHNPTFCSPVQSSPAVYCDNGPLGKTILPLPSPL